jgi:hypothetical protein
MTPEGLLHAINAARLRALPGAREFELRYAIAPLQRLVAAGPAEQQQLEPTLFDPAPLEVPRTGYWTPGKAAFWSLILAGGLFAWAWDRGLDEAWEEFQLRRRVRQRREGRRAFSMAENVDDILSLLMIRGARDMSRDADAAKAGEQQLGWRRLDAADAAAGGAAAAAGGAGGAAAVVVDAVSGQSVEVSTAAAAVEPPAFAAGVVVDVESQSVGGGGQQQPQSQGSTDTQQQVQEQQQSDQQR